MPGFVKLVLVMHMVSGEECHQGCNNWENETAGTAYVKSKQLLDTLKALLAAAKMIENVVLLFLLLFYMQLLQRYIYESFCCNS